MDSINDGTTADGAIFGVFLRAEGRIGLDKIFLSAVRTNDTDTFVHSRDFLIKRERGRNK